MTGFYKLFYGHKSQANRIKLSLTISVRISAFVRCGLNVGTGVDDTDGFDALAFAIVVLLLPTVAARSAAITRAIGIFSL